MAKLNNISLVEEMISKGYLSKRKHPNFDLYILNYTKSCQMNKVWNDVTTRCRGMIVDSEWNIVSRPYVKFFNYEEIVDKSEIPTGLYYKVYEKIDGTLGISYITPDGKVAIATRGSFDSDQAVWANDYINRPENNFILKLIEVNPRYTFLFEIVYPEDKKVVNYNGMKDLILTGIVETETGDELDIDIIKELCPLLHTAKWFDGVEDWTKIREMFSGENKEGYVVKFSNNYRVKMKYESWFRLNFIKGGLSKKAVLMSIINDDILNMMKLVGELDEENRIYYREMILAFEREFSEIKFDAMVEYKDFDTDKEAAMYFKTCKYPSIMFALRKGKPVDKLIWKMIKQHIKEEPEKEE